MVPISGQGIIVDPGLKPILQKAMLPPLGYSDVFLYSHGWWTRAEGAMIDYNQFIMGFAPIVASMAETIALEGALGIGLHWPAMVSEDANSPLTVLQPFTYFNRAKMADEVGEHGVYSILRILLEARRDAGIPLPRLHLTGHSFGCKVVCSALEQLAETFANTDLLKELTVNLVLLQGAFDHDALEPGKSYGRVLAAFPRLRILLSKSARDKAVGMQYELVQRVMNLFGSVVPGLGAVGPSTGTIAAADGVANVAVARGFAAPPPGSVTGRLIVADLEPLHAANPEGDTPFAGHHSDVFHDEIYRLMAAFYFS
jgi:hypothetical protein